MYHIHLPSAAAKRPTAAAKEHVEHVRGAGEASAAAAAVLDRRLAALIVDGTLLRIGQHLVRLRDLLEAFALVRVLVRVVLERQLAVGLLQLVGGGGRADAQPIVVGGIVDHGGWAGCGGGGGAERLNEILLADGLARVWYILRPLGTRKQCR